MSRNRQEGWLIDMKKLLRNLVVLCVCLLLACALRAEGWPVAGAAAVPSKGGSEGRRRAA